jgi:hypothetical protein
MLSLEQRHLVLPYFVNTENGKVRKEKKHLMKKRFSKTLWRTDSRHTQGRNQFKMDMSLFRQQ